MTQPAGDQYELIPFKAVPFTALTGAQTLVSRDCLVGGWSFKESTGLATAEIDIYDGMSIQSVAYAYVTMLAQESVRDVMPTPGIYFAEGLTLNVASGSVVGSVWVRLL